MPEFALTKNATPNIDMVIVIGGFNPTSMG
jgi:hypothetical protein